MSESPRKCFRIQKPKSYHSPNLSKVLRQFAKSIDKLGLGDRQHRTGIPMTTYQPNPEVVAASSVSNNQLNEIVEDVRTNYIEVVQAVIASLQRDESAMVSQTEEGHLWKFKYGSVEVFAQITGVRDEDTFHVWSPVLKLPANDEAGLMRKLLEMNWSGTFEACFGIFNDRVVVLSTRTLAELSPSEISRIITVVATIADENDEALQSEYGAV